MKEYKSILRRIYVDINRTTALKRLPWNQMNFSQQNNKKQLTQIILDLLIEIKGILVRDGRIIKEIGEWGVELMDVL
jgi:hypothetical protein